MGISIVLADNHQIFRQAIRALLEKESDMRVVGEAENGRMAVEMACEHRPDVVLMDVVMCGLNGIDAARKIVRRVPGTKVLALSIHSEKKFVEAMFEAGAVGYLHKDCVCEDLVCAVREAVGKRVGIGSLTRDRAAEDYFCQKPAADSLGFEVLSSREREVLQLLAEGLTSKQTAAALELSPKTVEKHRHNTMVKLGIHNIAELTKFAVREGLTSVQS